MVARACPSPMAGTAILTCRPNSHPFTERKLILDNSGNRNTAVKIGRSVARAKPGGNNGIFDCKVLSRNHALIWYSNGKFYLQDTKSSNGTYVNNQRLSKTNEESAPHELCSGDVVQFGVDVIETNRNTPVTHGCIIANLKLFLPDGKEAKASLSSTLISSMPLEELYQLNTCIQEALQRENLLKCKLAKLQQIVIDLKKSADQSWKALIQEDRLLSRVEFLESQLAAHSKSFTDDKLRDEVKLLHKDKSTYENQLKEVMKKMLAEKVEVMQKCQDTERKLANAENECLNLQEMLDKNREEIEELIKKYQDQVSKNKELETTIDQLLESNQEKSNTLEKLQFETLQAQKQLDAFTLKDNMLNDKLKHYYMSFHIIKEKMTNIRLELGQETKVDHNILIKYFDDVHDVMTQFDEYFLSEPSGLNSIQDIENVTKDLMVQMQTANEEHNVLQDSVQRNEEQLVFLEQSRYLHLDKIKGLKLKLDKLKQNYNSDCNENDKLSKTYENCDTILISEEEKTVKDINSYNSEKDFISINKEIEECSTNIDGINKEIAKCTSELVDVKNCLGKNEKWELNLQEQLSLLTKSKENLINLKLNSEANNKSLQTQLTDAFDTIKQYKVEHNQLTLEIESLRDKLKKSEDKESELKEDLEKLKHAIKNYQNNVLPNIVQSLHLSASEQEAVQDEMVQSQVQTETEVQPASEEDLNGSTTTLSETDGGLIEPVAMTTPVCVDPVSTEVGQELITEFKDEPTDSPSQVEHQQDMDDPEPTSPGDDDDTSDSSSEMTDSSTLIRVRKSKPTPVTTVPYTCPITTVSIATQTCPEDGLLCKVQEYFDSVDSASLSPLALLGIIVMFMMLFMGVVYSFENILSHVTGTYDPEF